MQAFLVAMALVVGADLSNGTDVVPQKHVVSSQQHAAVANYQHDAPSDPQASEGFFASLFGYWNAWIRPMPQTCYSPHFGCYPGNGRDIHRYPAFHGYYYRHPYNYRTLFEYPWHAEPHEPLAMQLHQEVAGAPVRPNAEVIPAPPPRFQPTR